MSNNPAFPMSREQAQWAIELSERYNPQIPYYYDTMFLDGFEPWEIFEAQHKTVMRDYIKRLDTYEASQRDPMDDVQIKIKSEVKVK